MKRCLSRKAAQNGLFIVKNHSATHSRDDLPGEQEVILFTTVKLQWVPQVTLQHVPAPLMDLCCESCLSLTPGSGHTSHVDMACKVSTHPWLPPPHPGTPLFLGTRSPHQLPGSSCYPHLWASLFFFLSLRWEKVAVDAAFAREFPDSTN